jgi:predicted amidohydrolase YtcJ
VGTNPEIRALAGAGTTTVDLAGKTALPGFIDAHSHFPSAGMDALFVVDLQSPPVGTVQTIEGLIAALKRRADETPKGRWVVGRGYDQTLLREKRHPTREDLDRASSGHPISIVHASGHLSVANSMALKMAQVTKGTPNPKGGVVVKDRSTGEPTGLFEEVNMVASLIPPRTVEETMQGITRAVAMYTAAGVTTATVAGNGIGAVRSLVEASARRLLPIRIHTMLRGAPEQVREARAAIRSPSEMLKAGAVKLTADGSIQGYTGYLREPYTIQPEGQTGYRGYPSLSREELVEVVKALHRDGNQIAIHANGDAAIDDVIFAFQEALRERPKADHRFRVEHAQMTREDQLDAFKNLGITPSFFVSHTYYWGDVHRDIFQGPVRAAHTSPLASALKRGVRFSIHLDTPVTPISPLQAIWSAVNRLTREGKVLGPDQRITPIDAIRAVTTDAAWQNFEENIKGSIEIGKLADLTLLAENPTTVDPAKIKDIQVVETIVGGKTVYSKQAPDPVRAR